MKFLRNFFMLPFGGNTGKPHNDNLRAGQEEYRAAFSVWASLVGFRY